MKKSYLFLLLFCASTAFAQKPSFTKLPDKSVDFRIATPVLSETKNRTHDFSHHTEIKKVKGGLYHITVFINTNKTSLLNSIDLPLSIELQTTTALETAKHAFHWVPNIKQRPDNTIAQHVFRSPCMIFSLAKKSIVFIPDIHAIKANQVAPYYMDLAYGTTNIQLHYGISKYRRTGRDYYEKVTEPFAFSEPFRFSFYVLLTSPDATTALQATNQFLWSSYGRPYTKTYLPQSVPFERYADTGYAMAMQHYWVQTDSNKGGITTSTFLDKNTNIYRGRDNKNDLWFHSWFNNARTAFGQYYWGKKQNQPEWSSKALQTMRLILESPTVSGWFPTIYLPEEKRWCLAGQGSGKDNYHLPDNAWTAYWILRFNDELQPLPGSDSFLLKFAGALLECQNPDGSFPARVKVDSHQADTVLQSSASGALGTWFLEEMLLRKKIPQKDVNRYNEAVKRSLEFITTNVLPNQRFDDFELYFSCSPKPMHYFDSTTNLYGQNTLSIQWCAEAYLNAYRLYHDKEYLKQGEYCLGILSLYQQVWNPPFINLYAFGGFGVMNTDSEWNDARQAQFAETYLHYYQATHIKEYLERSVYATRASFALMVLPENKEVCPANFMGTVYNGEQWSGTMAENYGHGGTDERSFQSGFHWGTGSALTTAAIMQQHLGDLYIDNNFAIGVNGMVVKSVQRRGDRISVTTEKLPDAPMQVKLDSSMKKATVLVDGVEILQGP